MAETWGRRVLPAGSTGPVASSQVARSLSGKCNQMIPVAPSLCGCPVWVGRTQRAALRLWGTRLLMGVRWPHCAMAPVGGQAVEPEAQKGFWATPDRGAQSKVSRKLVKDADEVVRSQSPAQCVATPHPRSSGGSLEKGATPPGHEQPSRALSAGPAPAGLVTTSCVDWVLCWPCQTSDGGAVSECVPPSPCEVLPAGTYDCIWRLGLYRGDGSKMRPLGWVGPNPV